MEKLSNLRMGPLGDSIYLRPFRLHFTQNNKDKNWDLMEQHDSVAIIIFNKTTKKLIFVKQFRPAAYLSQIPKEDRANIDTDKYPAKLGVTLELCAGIVDKKDKSLKQIAKEEVLEECGYDVLLQNLEEIISLHEVGALISKITLFYCEVTNDMKVSEGGGIDDELIEVVELTVDEIKSYISIKEINSPPSFLFAINWFLLNKKPQINC